MFVITYCTCVEIRTVIFACTFFPESCFFSLIFGKPVEHCSRSHTFLLYYRDTNMFKTCTKKIVRTEWSRTWVGEFWTLASKSRRKGRSQLSFSLDFLPNTDTISLIIVTLLELNSECMKLFYFLKHWGWDHTSFKK